MGDQCETFCCDWATVDPVYLNMEMTLLELALVFPPTGESLVDALVSAQPKEPPEHVLGSPPPEKPLQQVLPHLQAEAPLEDVLAPSQTLESLVTVLEDFKPWR